MAAAKPLTGQWCEPAVLTEIDCLILIKILSKKSNIGVTTGLYPCPVFSFADANENPPLPQGKGNTSVDDELGVKLYQESNGLFVVF